MVGIADRSAAFNVGMPSYRYELHRGEAVVATGHLSRVEPLEVGERIAISGHPGIVRRIEPLLGERELRLVVQELRDAGA
jgi:hypothetical protein